jgi:hypothetical protein
VEAEPLPSVVRIPRRWIAVAVGASAAALLGIGLALLLTRSHVDPPPTAAVAERPAAAETRPAPSKGLSTTNDPVVEPLPEPAPTRAPPPARRGKRSRNRVHERGTIDPFSP